MPNVAALGSDVNAERGANLTVLIHGTADAAARWYRPVVGMNLYRYLDETVYPGARELQRSFTWNGGRRRVHFERAARRLIEIIRSLGPAQLRLVCHSNGANVANLATQPGTIVGDPGLRVCTLVYLAPAVRRTILPHVDNVSSRQWFTFRPQDDDVLDLFGVPDRDYASVGLGSHETRRVIAPYGHWAPTEVDVWRDHDLARLVQSVCGAGTPAQST